MDATGGEAGRQRRCWQRPPRRLRGAVGTAAQGVSVALSADGNTAAVGGSGDNSFAGAAWVFVQTPPVPAPPMPVCTLASQLGDFNGDGRDDLLFRRGSDGLLSQYLM